MEEEDKEFFVLVLGVLAAIILVVSWWYMSGGVNGAAQPVVSDVDASHETDDSDGDDEDHDEEAAAPVEEEPAPREEEPEVVEEEEEEFELEPVEEEEPAPVEEEPEEAPAPVLPSTVVDVISGDGNLSVLGELLGDLELDQALIGDGPFTVLAPSNDAVNTAAASDTTVAVLTADGSSVLQYHVLPGRYTAQDLAEIARGGRATELETLQGESISLSLDGENIIINGNAMISGDAQEADNGLVHTLDNVLVPPVAALNALVGAEPILFDTGSATIQQESFETLDGFIEVLGASNVNVNIEGHTDSTGDPILNQNLSQSRARSVLNYLVANGIEESRLSAEGFGSSDPVGDNATEEGRTQNRRIEFEVG